MENSIFIVHSAIHRTIVHIIAIPFVLLILVSAIDKQYSLLASVLYVCVISFIQYFRAAIKPDAENILRRNTFFEILGFISLVAAFIVVFILLLVA